MSFELVLLITQTAFVGFLAAWLTTGVYENLFYSDLNATFTAEVLDMTRLRNDFPDAYERVAHRRVVNPTIQRFLFRFIVFWEVLATLALWVGLIALVMAVTGNLTGDIARAYALRGVLMFTSTWAGFLIAGNWFCYWFCHEGAQNTHYQMTLWGLGTAILIAI
ncbi:MAG: DUF2165 family protein [Pseudomonadota bacterium]